MEAQQAHIYDGFITLERGVDSGRTPASLQRNQVAFAVNATFRGGEPTCRPGFIKRGLAFKDSDGALDQTLLAAFQDGLFQGASSYEGGFGRSSIVASIGGRIYLIDVINGFNVTDVTPSTANSAVLPKSYFCQAEDFLIIQNKQSKPIVYNGSGTFRLTRDDDLPVGGAMAYGQGRVWVALPDGYRFVAGDLPYSSSGTEAYGYRDSVLKITENDYLNGGGYFPVPGDSGGITGMVFTNNLDTSLGQGPLLVFTHRLVASVQAPIDRTQWQNLSYPIQTIALNGYGALGDRSIATVNGDIFYRSDDGFRSFKVARRDFTQWGNTPISAEINRVIAADGKAFLDHCSSIVFDNRFLSTVSPYWVQGHGVVHRGLAVLDFDILSRMHGAQAPAWEGIWTGLNVLQLVKGWFNGVERCFAFVLNGANQIELWELSRDYPHDYGDAGDSRIEWSIEGKAHDFDTPFGQKSLEYGEVWVDQLQGDVNVSADFRPNQYPKWVQWHPGWTEAATDSMELGDDSTPPLVPRQQYRPKMRLPFPDSTADDTVDLSFRKFFTLQPRIQFVGKCRLRQLRLCARHDQEFARGEYRT